MVFADAAARTTALTGVVAEGMLSYLKDTNAVEVYNGSAWVASDDPNAIQNTIVDAKGDLITATAADVPARLAVSVSNTAFLRADSGESTGLKWDNDAWIAYTPTWTNLTVGNATQTFRYKQIGKTVFVTGLITLGSTSSITGLIDFTNPVSATSTNLQTVRTDVLLYRGGFNIGVLYPNGATKWYIRAFNTAGTYGGFTDTSATVPGTWTTGDFIAVSYTYEAA